MKFNEFVASNSCMFANGEQTIKQMSTHRGRSEGGENFLQNFVKNAERLIEGNYGMNSAKAFHKTAGTDGGRGFALSFRL